MTPKCCENCAHACEKGGCHHHVSCKAWREWFREKWDGFRMVAAQVKENRRTEDGNGKK